MTVEKRMNLAAAAMTGHVSGVGGVGLDGMTPSTLAGTWWTYMPVAGVIMATRMLRSRANPDNSPGWEVLLEVLAPNLDNVVTTCIPSSGSGTKSILVSKTEQRWFVVLACWYMGPLH